MSPVNQVYVEFEPNDLSPLLCVWGVVLSAHRQPTAAGGV